MRSFPASCIPQNSVTLLLNISILLDARTRGFTPRRDHLFPFAVGPSLEWKPALPSAGLPPRAIHFLTTKETIDVHLKSRLGCWAVGLVVIASTGFANEPITVAIGQGKRAPQQPQAAVGPNGTVHLVYGVEETVFHCQSTDRGTSFDKPREAFRVSNLALGMRRGPRIAVTKDAVVVTAIGGRQGKGRDGDLQSWRSTDGGLTWNGPSNVNDIADSAREGLHGMAAGPDDSIWCVWLDLREKRSEIFSSKSTDGGATWQPNILVYRSPDGNVCECCHPSIAVNQTSLHVMFRNSLAGSRDMFVATANPEGETFSAAKKIGRGTWKLDACPMDGGMISANPAGVVETVWRRDGEVFAVKSLDGIEKSLGRGEQPWITNSISGAAIVWTTGREGDLLVLAPGRKEPKKIAAGARDPMVVSSVKGEELVIACWESKRDGQSVVMAARIDLGKAKLPK